MEVTIIGVAGGTGSGKSTLVRQLQEAFREEDVEVIVTDCMGFSAEMGRIVARESGKQVLVPRLVLPKLVKALLVQQ